MTKDLFTPMSIKLKTEEPGGNAAHVPIFSYQ